MNQSNEKGRIVRIRLRNFMSYTDIDIHPGFNLNLIIGPNGTGKSTFVCAVVLGLGGKSRTLGRGDDLSSFVKNGCTESIIDIELYDPDVKNVVITRKISKNKSQFYIDGKPVTGSKVQDVQREYNLQVDNLCTFLPQERVQDFSKLNPQQLLDQTQKTIGNCVMVSNFEKLKNLQKHLQEDQKICDALKEQIDCESQKNLRLTDKVHSFIEKRALLEKRSSIQQKIAWLNYHNNLILAKEIIKDLNLAEEKYAEKKKKLRSLVKNLSDIEDDVKGLKDEHLNLKRNEGAKMAMVEDRLKRLRERLEQLEDFDGVIQAKLKEEESKKEDLKQYVETVDKLKNDIHTIETKNGTDEDLKVKEEAIGKDLRNAHEEQSRVTDLKIMVEDEEAQLQKDIKSVISECRLLEKQSNFRLEYLRRNEPDVYKSVEWLKNNRHIFQSHIYNPMVLELDVPNVNMAKYVETRISYRDLISFTCTNPDDLNLLIQKLRTEQKLKINVICSDEEDTTQYLPEISLDQIRPLGFFSYMNDLITGPSDIIRFLCKVYKIHCIPIGNDTVKSKCDQVPSKISIFFSDKHMFTVKTSIYSGDKSINVKQLNEPKLFSVSLNNRRLQQLIEKERELKDAIEVKQQKLRLMNHKLKGLAENLENVRRRKRELATIREEKKEILMKLKRAEDNVKSIEETLMNPSVLLREADKEKTVLKKEIVRSLKNLREAHENLNEASHKRQNHEIKLKISNQRVKEALRIKENCAENVKNLEVALNSIKDRKHECDLKCEKLKEAAKQTTNGLSHGEKGFEKFEGQFQKLKNTIKDLEADLEKTQMKVDLLHGGNEEVLTEFEKRKEEIAKMLDKLESKKRNLEDGKAKMAALRDQWLDPINDLVNKINQNFGNFFENMGCAGEVCLTNDGKEDDFDQYGITIKVKFRDEIPLQKLGRNFQSGGERAVATAVYLLSLQELISIPFRFVDEINQGMDPANEKRIMDLLIRVTSSKKSTQYFFITPKVILLQ